MSDAALMTRAQKEMVKSDLQGGTVSYNNADYDCTVGTFTKQDVLVSGGISPMMLGDIQLLLGDFPVDVKLGIGQWMTVKPNTGPVRKCKIYQWRTSGNRLDITLHDVNEGA